MLKDIGGFLVEIYAPVFLIYLLVPLVVCFLPQKNTQKHGKTQAEIRQESFITSFVCMLLFPTALTMLGNSELSSLIEACQNNEKHTELFYLFLKNLGYATIICLGGHNMIAKIYKSITGDDFEKQMEAVEVDVNAVKDGLEDIKNLELSNIAIDDISKEMVNIMEEMDNHVLRDGELKPEEISIIETLIQKNLVKRLINTYQLTIFGKQYLKNL